MGAFLLTTTVEEVVSAPPVWFGTIFALLVVSAIVFVLFRLGLLAAIVMFFVNFVLGGAVLTLDTSKWFFSTTVALLLFVAGLAVSGFYVSRAGEPMLGRRILE